MLLFVDYSIWSMSDQHPYYAGFYHYCSRCQRADVGNITGADVIRSLPHLTNGQLSSLHTSILMDILTVYQHLCRLCHSVGPAQNMSPTFLATVRRESLAAIISLSGRVLLAARASLQYAPVQLDWEHQACKLCLYFFISWYLLCLRLMGITTTILLIILHISREIEMSQQKIFHNSVVLTKLSSWPIMSLLLHYITTTTLWVWVFYHAG